MFQASQPIQYVFNQSLNRASLQPYHHYIYENILSDTDIKQEKISEVYESFAKNDLASTILSVASISSFNQEKRGIDNKTFQLHIVNKYLFSQMFSPALGIYSPSSNIIFIKEDSTPEVLLHEHTHQTMDILFNNNCNPYKNTEQKTLYSEAIFSTLHYINSELSANISNPHKYSNSSNLAKDIIKSLNLQCKDFLFNPDIIDDARAKELLDILQPKKTNNIINTFLTPIDYTAPEILNILDTYKIESESIKEDSIESSLTQGYLEEGQIDFYMSYSSSDSNHAYEKFLCIYEFYEESKFDAETIACFYQVSIDSAQKKLFPHIYHYTQEVISPAAEEYHLEHTTIREWSYFGLTGQCLTEE